LGKVLDLFFRGRFFKEKANSLRKREREFRRKSEFSGKKFFEENIKKNVKFEV
jgi:hypothetical protein